MQMQPDPANSTGTKMISADDHGWDEQDQYESDIYQALLRLLIRRLGPLPDDVQAGLKRICSQAFLDSLQKKWEAGEALIMVLRALRGVAKEQGFENLSLEEIEHRFRVEIELGVKEAYERHTRGRFLAGVDTGNVSSSRHVPMAVRNFDLSLKVDNQLEAKHKPIHFTINLTMLYPTMLFHVIYTINPTMLSCFMYTTNPTMLFYVIYILSLLDVMSKFYHGSRRRSYSGPFNTSTNKKTGGSISANPWCGEKGLVLHSADAKGNRVRKNIAVISRGSSSEGTSSLTGASNHHREINSAYDDMPLVILDSQAQENCTGNFNVLSNLTIGSENIVLVAANGGEMETYMSGSVHQANFELNDVRYCPDLGNIVIVSGSKLDEADYEYKFSRGKFVVKDLRNDTTVGEGRLVDGNYILEYLRISGDRSRVQRQPGLATTVWNIVCSALHCLGLKH